MSIARLGCVILSLLLIFTSAECKKQLGNAPKTNTDITTENIKQDIRCSKMSKTPMCQLLVNFCPLGRTLIFPKFGRDKKTPERGRKISEDSETGTNYDDYDYDYDNGDDVYGLHHLLQDLKNDILQNIDERIEEKMKEILRNKSFPKSAQEENSISLTATPNNFIPGVTKTLFVNCSFAMAIKRQRILSIRLQKRLGSMVETLALISVGEEILFLDHSIGEVRGHLSEKARGTSYLEVSWFHPTDDVKGYYSCSVRTMNDALQVEQVNQHVLVTVLLPQGLEKVNSSVILLEDILDNITAQMSERASGLQDQVNDLLSLSVAMKEELNLTTINITTFQAIIREQQTRIRQLSEQMNNMSTSSTARPESDGEAEAEGQVHSSHISHIENGQVVCVFDPKKDISFRFSRPYSSSPFVFLSTSVLDFSHTKNLRLTIQAKSITEDGFVLKCATWHDTIAHHVVVSWISLGS